VPLSASELRDLELAAASLGLGWSARSTRQLERYVDELRLWIPRLNLVSRRDAEGLFARHVLDSLAAVPLLAETQEDAIVADVGSGAGLPGIPLAVALAPRRFVLIEPRRKRASFLRAAARAVAPAQVEVRECRVEDLAGGDLENRLAASVTRAALASDEYLAAVHPLLASGGQALAFRSASDAEREASWPGFEGPEVHRYALEDGRRSFSLVRWRRSGGSRTD
jgi:16S rRNA (guanine527-N7)-methyltransferase